MQADESEKEHGEKRSRIDHRSGKRIFLHDATFWSARIAERERLGETVHAYCTSRGLALSTFRRWAQRLDGERPSAHAARQAKFLEVPIVEREAQSGAEAAIEVGLQGGVQVKLSGDAAMRVIALVVSRVERAVRT